MNFIDVGMPAFLPRPRDRLLESCISAECQLLRYRVLAPNLSSVTAFDPGTHFLLLPLGLDHLAHDFFKGRRLSWIPLGVGRMV